MGDLTDYATVPGVKYCVNAGCEWSTINGSANVKYFLKGDYVRVIHNYTSVLKRQLLFLAVFMI